jgi:hypothetical protein
MQAESALIKDDPQRGILSVQWIFRGAFALFALIDCWLTRFKMEPDGVSYLDMGDLYWRGDWHAALNAYWSPLYGWLTGLMFLLTKPSMRWEYPEVHLLNFVIFLAAMASYEFFWRSMLESRIGNAWTGASRLYAWILGYLLFAILFFGSAFGELLGGDELGVLSPDLLVAALAFLAFGFVLRFSAGRLGVGSSCVLGVTLGVAYLSKAVMFPFGLVVLATLFAVCWKRRDGWRKAGAALVCFLAISTPFMALLSWNNNHLTFGDPGKLNIGWHVNGGWPPLMHWQGQGPSSGHPLHPTRKLMAWPEVYEFATPVAGTYPVWYDPTYWWAGVDTKFYPRREIGRMVQTLPDLGLYVIAQSGMPTAIVLAIFLISDRLNDSWRQLIRFLPVLAPSIALLVIYSMVTWWPRYIFWVILAGLCSLIASTSISAEAQRTRVFKAASIALGVVLIGVVMQQLKAIRWDSEAWMQNFEVAEKLRTMGVEPGSPVAVIGDSFRQEEYWARLDRVKIVAEVPRRLETGDSAAAFWSSSHEVEQAVLNALKSTGAIAVVAASPPKVLPPGWVPVGKTGQAIYFFR